MDLITDVALFGDGQMMDAAAPSAVYYRVLTVITFGAIVLRAALLFNIIVTVLLFCQLFDSS